MTSFSVLHIDIEMQLNGSTYGNYFGTLKLEPAETEWTVVQQAENGYNASVQTIRIAEVDNIYPYLITI